MRLVRNVLALACMSMCSLSLQAAQPAKSDSLLYKAYVDSAYNALGEKRLSQTEYYFKKAIETLPKHSANGLIWDNLGRIQRDLNRNEDALASFGKAIGLFPTALRFLRDRASLLIAMGREAQALDDYTRVLAIQKDDEVALLYRAWIYVKQRKFEEARRDYETLLKANPSHYEGLLGLAILNQKEGRLNEAILQLTSLISTHPDKAELYSMRAQVEEEKGQTDAALLDISEAIHRDTDNREYYVHRATLYLKESNKLKARRDLDKAVSLGMEQGALRELYRKCR